MLSLRDAIYAARGRRSAVWHFNFSELTALKAAARAARDCGVPIIMGLSEGERSFVGLRAAVALIRAYRAEGLPLYLNADHTRSFEGVKAAIDAGFDAVIFDGTHLSLEENISATKRAVLYARAAGERVVVEGELGYIGTQSEVLEKIPDGIQKTDPEDAARFARETGIDCFAPSVGNIHGMVRGGHEPMLDIPLVRMIRQVVRAPLVLHGASGNGDAELRAAVMAGVSVIHVNTELRKAWREGLEESFHSMEREVAPYKLLAASEEGMYRVIRAKIGILNN
jgi:fructose-bisphosphate aldolase class II